MGLVVYLDNPLGERVSVCDQFELLDYMRILNGRGFCKLRVGAEFDSSQFVQDGIIEVHRSPRGRVEPRLEDVYFIVAIDKGIDEKGRTFSEVIGYNPVDLLFRRIIDYVAGSAQATKGADNADDMMKEYVDENMGASATDSNRDLESSYNFTIQADHSLGPNVAKGAAWKNLYDVLVEISASTLALNDPIFFDIVPVTVSPLALEFRTYHLQRGADRSWPDGTNPVILNVDRGNLRNPRLSYDYRDEFNYVVCGGQGVGSDRDIQRWWDVTRIGQSPWNRREAFKDGRHCDVGATTCLDAAAQDHLERGRPIRTFTGEVVETEGTAYGIDWEFGDRLTAEFLEETFTVYVSGVRVTKSGDGAEEIDAKLFYQDTSTATEDV